MFVCLFNLKHAPSRELPLTARKTVFGHLNAMLLNTCIRNERRKNCEESIWQSQSALVWPLTMPRLIDAKISLVPNRPIHSTFNLIGSCNKHSNIQSHKVTKIHKLTPLTYELFFKIAQKWKQAKVCSHFLQNFDPKKSNSVIFQIKSKTHPHWISTLLFLGTLRKSCSRLPEWLH